jgi:SecD/SecF fusion protein
MPSNISGRVLLIATVLYVALSLIFPSVPPSLFWFFHPKTEISLRPNLKPGIDMVGGTSLLYEIKTPAGSRYDPELANQVMTSLKKRVDPEGVRNLIWRPQGATRLEIQMPLTSKSGESKQAREEFAAAQRQLEATNLRVADVAAVIEGMSGNERAARIKELSLGSAQRERLLTEMAATWDTIEQARAEKNAAVQAEAEEKYDALKLELSKTNVGVSELQSALEAKKGLREQRLAAIRSASAGFEPRAKAVENFIAKYEAYNRVKASIDDASELKRLLQGSGVLEFHILATDLPQGTRAEMVQRLDQGDTKVRANDFVQWFPVERPEELGHPEVTHVDPNGKVWALAYITPDKSMTNRDPTRPRWSLQRAFPELQMGEAKVGFLFDPQGARYFSQLTGENVGKPLAILLDDKLISAPNINSQIGAQGVIQGGRGGFTKPEQNYLISTLNAGALPAQLTEEPISERTVGPQLGSDNLRSGLQACFVGLIVVGIFLVCYYYLAGIVAFVAVLMNLVLILGAMAMLNATFTLPGVAGIVLTIGAAVDANVLIFERLREEQQRGLSLRMALRNAYDRAWSAIVDSNATTVITSLLLVWLGSEEVRGFGITLLIGLVSSLFTSLFVTKTIFAILVDKFGIQHLGSLPLTFPRWDRLLRPNVDWMGKIWVFVVFSVVFTVIGCVAFVWKYHQGELLDIEFASGTSVQFDLKNPTHIQEVRKIIDAADPKTMPSPSVVSVGSDDRSYEVVTPNADAPRVRAEVLKLLGDRLKVDLPSKFEGVRQPLESVMNTIVVPLQTGKESFDGFTPPGMAAYRGGVAIHLKNIDPPLTVEQIKQRIDRQRLQPQAGQAAPVYREYAVEAPRAGEGPVSSAIVLVNDPNLPYSATNANWRDQVAVPAWNLVNDAVNAQAQLQSVKNFDASIAADTQRDAFLAMGLSLLLVMAYIWLRFGNLKFGTATVVAMVHDTLMVLAAIGMAHLIYQYVPPVAHALMLEPFRLNLTLVASILTVMSYSMIDTIVVFDRVRENRGKFGHLDRKIVNDSINQTLSRTLLTAGTTVVTVFFMYVFGGAGIHGFTFVLLFGILVGTYSSIAIASPILLITRRPQESRAAAPARQGQLQRA